MNKRDFDYIEHRLLAPDVAVGEAIGRMKQVLKYGDISFMEREELEQAIEDAVIAHQNYADLMREVRKKLTIMGRRYA